jgi:hypothetical protein
MNVRGSLKLPLWRFATPRGHQPSAADFPVGIDQDGLPVVVTNFQGLLVRPSHEQKEILGSMIQESVRGMVKSRGRRRFLAR